jgi:hypothetical protein
MILASENTITLVPNPASDVLKVDLQEKFSSGRTVVNIYNLLGEQVKHVTSENESSIQMDVDQLPPGQYLVKSFMKGVISRWPNCKYSSKRTASPQILVKNS